jgi:hypothetical protein
MIKTDKKSGRFFSENSITCVKWNFVVFYYRAERSIIFYRVENHSIGQIP